MIVFRANPAYDRQKSTEIPLSPCFMGSFSGFTIDKPLPDG